MKSQHLAIGAALLGVVAMTPVARSLPVASAVNGVSGLVTAAASTSSKSMRDSTRGGEGASVGPHGIAPYSDIPRRYKSKSGRSGSKPQGSGR
ncbi:MAG TPA: hypothetical protein VIG55_15205 [Methylosinus sp.]